jgi:glycosyl transferase family 25
MTTQEFSAILLNLDRDVARREHMQKQLTQAFILYTRQSGVLGDDVPDDVRSYFYDDADHPKTTMKRGEIGCYASHLRALKRVAAGEYGAAVLIMEDDLDISTDLKQIISDAMKAMPEGWDILRLSCVPRRAYVSLARLGKNYFLSRYSKIPNSAGAYLVTPAGAQKFLQRGVRGLTFDDDLRRPWFHYMETYGVVPAPIRPGVLKSTIDAIEEGRFDKGMSSSMERTMRGDHFHALRRVYYNMANLGFLNWLFCTIINLADMAAKPILRNTIIDGAAKMRAKAFINLDKRDKK